MVRDEPRVARGFRGVGTHIVACHINTPVTDGDDDGDERTTTLGRYFQRDRRRRRRVRRGENASFSLSTSFLLPLLLLLLPVARARPRRTRAWESRPDTLSFSVSPSPRRASTRLRRAGPVQIPLDSREGESVDSDTRSARAIHTLLSSCADRTRGGGRARAAPRDHGRYAVDPRAAAARNRVNASPVVLLVHFGRRPRAARDGGPLSSSSLVADRFIHDSREDSGGRVSRALVTGERPTVARTRAPGTAARKQSLVT